MSSRAGFLESTFQSRSRSLTFGGTFVLLALVTALVAVIPNMAFIAISAFYVGVFLAYLGLRSDPQGGYLFEVIIPFSVLGFLYFGVGTMYIVMVPEAMHFPALVPFLLPAHALLTLGFTCFLVGYGWFFRRTLPSPLGRFAPRHVLVYLVPAALGAIGLSLDRLQNEGMMNDRGISPAISILQQFGNLFFFGWFLAWYMLWAKRLRPSIARPLLVMLSAMAAMILFFTFGGKQMVVMVLGMPAVAYYEVKRRLPAKSMLVVALLFVFIVFPTYNTYRNVNRNLDMSRRLDQTLSLTRSWDSNKYMDASLFAFLERVSVVTSVAAVISDTGRWVDYRYGETLILAPIGVFIPRFLWPDKPPITIGKEFGATFRLIGSMDRETYIAPSFVGELYWNFAVPGVVFGMCLLGMAYRWYYQRYGAGEGFDPIRKAVYFTLFANVLSFESNVAFMATSTIKTLIILVSFLVLFRRLGWFEDASQA
jgi:hypothetical protein